MAQCHGPVVLNAIAVGDVETPAEVRLREAAARIGAGIVISPRLASRHDEEIAPYVEAAARACAAATQAGVTVCYVDALAYPVGGTPTAARASLRRIEAYRADIPGAIPLAAVGNVSHGARPPRASALRVAYAVRAVEAGIGALILPVEDTTLVAVTRGAPAPDDPDHHEAGRLLAG